MNKTVIKKFELQFDEKPNGYVIRLNDEKGCVLRICQIPKELMESGGFVDVAYPKSDTYTMEDLKKAYEIGRVDRGISDKEGKDYNTLDQWFPNKKEDNGLLLIYMEGFNDELNGTLDMNRYNGLNKTSYLLGSIDAIVGDDVRSVDYQTNETILKRIRR